MSRICFVKPWKLSRILQPFLPPEYSISDVNEINFFLKATNRFMQEIFSPDQNYVVIATKIISYLDLSSLWSVSESFKFAIDRETQLWTSIYNKQKEVIMSKQNFYRFLQAWFFVCYKFCNYVPLTKDLFKTCNVLPFSCTHLAWCLLPRVQG